MTPATPTLKNDPRGESALESLLDELQTFAKPNSSSSSSSSSKKPGKFVSMYLGVTECALVCLFLLLSPLYFPSSFFFSLSYTLSSYISVALTLIVLLVIFFFSFVLVTVPPPRSSSRINEQASQLMLLSSLTAAALVSARNAAAGASVMRSNSIPASAADLSITYRPKSTPPVHTLAGLDDSFDEETLNPADTAGPFESLTSPMSDIAPSSSGGVASKSRQQILEDRHQELLRKQRLLQEQYSKLQMLSRGHIPKGLLNELKKTGSESNIMSKSLPPSAFTGTLNGNDGDNLTDKCSDLMSQSVILGSGAHTISGGNINAFLPHLKQQIMQQRTAQALLEQQLQQSADALKMSGSNMVPLINGSGKTQVDRSVLAAAAAAAVMSNTSNNTSGNNNCSPASTFVNQVTNNFVNDNGTTTSIKSNNNTSYGDTTSNIKIHSANTMVNVNNKSCSNTAPAIVNDSTNSSTASSGVRINFTSNKINPTGSPRRTNASHATTSTSSGKLSSPSNNANVHNNSSGKFETQVYETDII